jgi:hypothetical protein
MSGMDGKVVVIRGVDLVGLPVQLAARRIVGLVWTRRTANSAS